MERPPCVKLGEIRRTLASMGEGRPRPLQVTYTPGLLGATLTRSARRAGRRVQGDRNAMGRGNERERGRERGALAFMPLY